jgi:hypothetical protein
MQAHVAAAARRHFHAHDDLAVLGEFDRISDEVR